MRTIMMSVAFGFALAACAPAEGEIVPTEDGPFVADMDAADKVLDDLGFEVAREDLGIERRIDPDLERDLRDRVVVEPGCRPVAYLSLTWSNNSNAYRGRIYSLGGRPVARTRGFYAPITDDGGTFAGAWAAPSLEDDPTRMGPIGGVYTADHSFYGQATYGDMGFPMRGLWRRTSKRGGVALAVIAHCD